MIIRMPYENSLVDASAEANYWTLVLLYLLVNRRPQVSSCCHLALRIERPHTRWRFDLTRYPRVSKALP